VKRLGKPGMIDQAFWQSRRVFITGHTGFKGSWLCLWLNQMGATVKGYALEPPTMPSLFEEARVGELIDSEIGDIRDLEQLQKSLNDFKPDVVIHMAAQPLVRYSYIAPLETYAVNVLGTANVLESALTCESVRSVVSVTTDKCYENKEWPWAYREYEPMGGHDPYSSSKGCAELVTTSYRQSFYSSKGKGLASARAGNVVGGGDWAPDRLIPDILRAFEKDQPVVIRSPNAIRPWQHVLEPLNGYLQLAEALFENPEKYSGGWNFGPDDNGAQTVNWILDRVVSEWPGSSWKLDESEMVLHEANYLKLDISKAKTELGWSPVWGLKHTIKKIVDWHRCWLKGQDMQEMCFKQIASFSNDS